MPFPYEMDARPKNRGLAHTVLTNIGLSVMMHQCWEKILTDAVAPLYRILAQAHAVESAAAED